MNTATIARDIERSDLQELIETPRPTAEQRTRDLENSIGTFEYLITELRASLAK